ncbi:hypothetical protein TSAR_008287 [Trichomalopsis sarcophagae]|uniref:Secreted protein n=1 Tax=Trichomalopsis sarcophagae TaxID=543379 RepID=A0A232F542_9HYME|nr:hypothetical protein TSAR_008287 [Trichomalopsis sarcophagae]
MYPHTGAFLLLLASRFITILTLLASYGFVSAAEELGLGTTLPTAPTELAQYPKLCELRRKFPVLYRVEFQQQSRGRRSALKPTSKLARIANISRPFIQGSVYSPPPPPPWRQ